MFDANGAEQVSCVTSDLCRLETRVLPLHEGDQRLLNRYDAFFSTLHAYASPMSSGVFYLATQIRAEHRLKTPDALHLASALHSGCDEFWTLDINSFDFPDEDTEDGDYMSSGPEQFDEEEDILMEVDSTESGPCSNEAVGKPGPKYAFRHLAKTGAANATIAAAEPEVPGRRTAAELSPAKAPQCKAARTSAAVLGSNAGLSVSLSPNSLSEISVSDPLAPSSYAAVTATNPVPSLFSGGASAVQDDDGVRRRFQPRGGGRKKR